VVSDLGLLAFGAGVNAQITHLDLSSVVAHLIRCWGVAEDTGFAVSAYESGGCRHWLHKHPLRAVPWNRTLFDAIQCLLACNDHVSIGYELDVDGVDILSRFEHGLSGF